MLASTSDTCVNRKMLSIYCFVLGENTPNDSLRQEQMGLSPNFGRSPGKAVFGTRRLKSGLSTNPLKSNCYSRRTRLTSTSRSMPFHRAWTPCSVRSWRRSVRISDARLMPRSACQGSMLTLSCISARVDDILLNEQMELMSPRHYFLVDLWFSPRKEASCPGKWQSLLL